MRAFQRATAQDTQRDSAAGATHDQIDGLRSGELVNAGKTARQRLVAQIDEIADADSSFVGGTMG